MIAESFDVGASYIVRLVAQGDPSVPVFGYAPHHALPRTTEPQRDGDHSGDIEESTNGLANDPTCGGVFGLCQDFDR